MKDNGRNIILMGRGRRVGQMGLFMKDVLRMGLKRVKGLFYSLLRISMKGSSNRIRFKAMDSILLLMAIIIRDNGLIIRGMVMENYYIIMVIFTRANSIRIK
jgi:uncharacterized membrane protein